MSRISVFNTANDLNYLLVFLYATNTVMIFLGFIQFPQQTPHPTPRQALVAFQMATHRPMWYKNSVAELVCIKGEPNMQLPFWRANKAK
jgi:hypothetical protein